MPGSKVFMGEGGCFQVFRRRIHGFRGDAHYAKAVVAFLLLRLLNPPAGRCHAVLQASPAEMCHVLDGEEAINVIRNSMFQNWDLHNQPAPSMNHGTEVTQHPCRSW